MPRPNPFQDLCHVPRWFVGRLLAGLIMLAALGLIYLTGCPEK
jgi:hypothetical protein